MSADPISSLRDYRLSFGLSLADVAARLASTEDRIAAMEQGKTRLQPHEIDLLAVLYGVTEDEISRAIAAMKQPRRLPKPNKHGVDLIEPQETT